MKFDHYILRPPLSEDAESVFELIMTNKPRLIDYFPLAVGSIHSLIDTAEYIKLKTAQLEKKEAYTWLIIDTKTEKPIGFTFIKNIEWKIPKAEIAYYIDKHYEGKGIVSKALKLTITYCFDALKMNKLFLRAAIDNPASQRVAIKNGFLREGILRSDFRKADGKLIDLHYYGLVKQA